MLTVLAAAYASIYFFLPVFYEDYEMKKLDEFAQEVEKECYGMNTEDMSAKLKSLFRGNWNYAAIALNDTNEIIFSYAWDNDYFHMYVSDSGGNIEYSYANLFKGKIIEKSVKILTSSNSYITLTISGTFNPIDEAVPIISSVFPYSLVVCVIISAVFSFLFSRSISKPINSIAKETEKMKIMDSSAHCKAESCDEIRTLANNVNEMYSTLLLTIETLKKEVENVSQNEKAKVDFLQTASHELKTPVTAAIGMLEGMKYNVGEFSDRDKYIDETLGVLNGLSESIKEIIRTSRLNMYISSEDISTFKLKQFVSKIISPYLVIARSQKTEVEININSDSEITTSEELFEKALSNIISNAVKYTDGKVSIYTNQNTLFVDNECIPLDDEFLETIYTPFNADAKGNGLGMYIISTTLRLCNMKYDFSPYEKGMRFTIKFK